MWRRPDPHQNTASLWFQGSAQIGSSVGATETMAIGGGLTTFIRQGTEVEFRLLASRAEKQEFHEELLRPVLVNEHA